jgi:Reverse transcriptase (RNA-dependent DNA polymerase)
MGLKGAPSYFQRVMAIVVLEGLIWIHGVELYLDDLLVHASTFPDFMSRLRKVLERLEKHNITLNPTKCEFGLSEVEYVGYVINEQGYTLSDERKEAVFQIPRPTVVKHMKSFRGAANYFRSHIPDFCRKIVPLNMMIENYDRRRKLEWTEEAEASWKSIRKAIRLC